MRVVAAWLLPLALAAPTSLELWEANRDSAVASLTDEFVLGIGAGTLRREAFATYVAQDAAFLAAFADAYKRTIAKCPAGMPRCAEDLGTLAAAVDEELELHAAYAKKWGADLSAGFAPLPATTAYVDFLDAVSRDPASSAAEVVAAMAPCMVLYAALGDALNAAGAAWFRDEMARGVVRSNPYAEWVHTYASPDFRDAAALIENLFDALAARDDVDAGRARELYARAMALEYDFFKAQARPPRPAAADFAAAVAGLLASGYAFGPTPSPGDEL